MSRGVTQESGVHHGIRRVGPGRSGCHSGQHEGESVAFGSDRFQRHLPPCDGPFIVLFEKDGADQAGDGHLVGE